MKRHALTKLFDNFVRNITPEDKLAILHHTDADGICSAAITSRAIEILRGRPADAMRATAYQTSKLGDKTLSLIEKNNINKVIVVDVALDYKSKVLENISELANVLIIDHHEVYSKSSERITIIKPPLLGIKKYYPASKLVYDLFSDVVDIEHLDWLAAAGLIADRGYPENKKFVNSTLKKYNFPIKTDIFETVLGQTGLTISCSDAIVPSKIEEALEILMKAEKPLDVLTSKLAGVKNRIDKEIKRELKRFETRAERYPGLAFYELSSKFRIKAEVINVLSDKYPHTTLIVYSRSGDHYVISGRRQDRKVAVNRLLEKAVKGLEHAGGGGHKPAAGAYILAKDISIFKNKIKEK